SEDGDDDEQDSVAESFGLTCPGQLLLKVATSVNSIRRTKIFERFFTIKKHELHIFRQARRTCQRASDFQENAIARSAIIRADKPKCVENFCVVVGAQQKIRFGRITETRDQIRKVSRAVRRLIREGLLGHRPPE